MVARGSNKAGGKKLTKEQIEEVLSRAVQGTSPGEIARLMGVDGLRVSGTIRAAKNAGKIPATVVTKEPKPPRTGDPFPLVPAGQQSVAPPLAAPRPATPQVAAAVPVAAGPEPSADGHAWSSDPAHRSGYQNPGQTEKFQVERFAPNNDGLVGSYPSAPDDDEIAMKFGQGTYRITRLVPGRVPEFREFPVSGAYGPPRWPRPGSAGSVSPASAPAGGERPPYGGGRWGGGRPQMPRPGMTDEDDGRDFPAPPRPRSSRPSFDGRERDRGFEREDVHLEERYRDLRERERAVHDRTLEPLSHAPQESAVAKSAVENMNKMHERTLEQYEQERKDRREHGPDGTIREFFTGQQEYQRRTAEEERVKGQERIDAERKREDERQEAERKRDSERRKDDEDRQRRWSTEQDERHRRDMERIKEERKTLLDLEAKKMDLIREESKAREDLLTRQIDENIKRVEEANAASEARIAEIQEQVAEDLERNRKSSEREDEMRVQTHDLKSQHLDNEHALKKEMIDLRGEVLKNQNTDDITKLLAPLLDGVKDVIGKVVELKKFQAATPEDRAAQMSQPAPVVHEIDHTTVPVVDPGADQQPATQSAPAGNGAAAPAPAPAAAPPGAVGNMTADTAIRAALDTDVAKYILNEWSRNLTAGRDPAMFVNTFMEFMKDETPDGASGRKGCAAFIQIMDTRDWPEMKALLEPSIPQDLKPAFELEGAAQFYNAFRVMACGSVRDYWAMYLADKKQQEDAQRAAAQSQQPPQEEGKPAAPAPESEQPPAAAPSPAAPGEPPPAEEPPPSPPPALTAPQAPPAQGALPATPVDTKPPVAQVPDVVSVDDVMPKSQDESKGASAPPSNGNASEPAEEKAKASA